MKIGPNGINGTPEEISDYLINNGLKFDVFISYKSEDFPYAKKVFDVLTEAGYRPFLSEISLKEVPVNRFHEVIDKVLENSDHLVIMGSCRENMEAPWVQAEWRLFDVQRKSGKKGGNIVPVLCGDMTSDDLPFSLSIFNVISINDSNWEKTLINYLPRS